MLCRMKTLYILVGWCIWHRDVVCKYGLVQTFACRWNCQTFNLCTFQSTLHSCILYIHSCISSKPFLLHPTQKLCQEVSLNWITLNFQFVAWIAFLGLALEDTAVLMGTVFTAHRSEVHHYSTEQPHTGNREASPSFPAPSLFSSSLTRSISGVGKKAQSPYHSPSSLLGMPIKQYGCVMLFAIRALFLRCASLPANNKRLQLNSWISVSANPRTLISETELL